MGSTNSPFHISIFLLGSLSFKLTSTHALQDSMVKTLRELCLLPILPCLTIFPLLPYLWKRDRLPFIHSMYSFAFINKDVFTLHLSCVRLRWRHWKGNKMEETSSLSPGQEEIMGNRQLPSTVLPLHCAILASSSKQPYHFILKRNEDQRGQGHTADIPSLWLNVEFLTPKPVFIT